MKEYSNVQWLRGIQDLLYLYTIYIIRHEPINQYNIVTLIQMLRDSDSEKDSDAIKPCLFVCEKIHHHHKSAENDDKFSN